MKDTLTLLAFLALTGALVAVEFYAEPEYPDCFTDSCVFARCSQELGRPCTDDDVFGPAQESECDDMPMDDDCHTEER